MRYIIEKQNGNPRLLKQRGDVYEIIGYGAGEASTEELVEIARLANQAVEEGNR